MALRRSETFTTPNGHVIPLDAAATVFPHGSTVGTVLAPPELAWEDIDRFYTQPIQCGVYTENDVPLLVLHVVGEWTEVAALNTRLFDDDTLEPLLHRGTFAGRDTVPFFLVSREDGKTMAERAMLMPSRMTESLARAAERQHRRFISRSSVERAVRSVRDAYSTADLMQKAGIQPLAPASFG
jgi:hypothetical protein